MLGGRLVGCYRWRDDRRSLYLKVGDGEASEVSWQERGREHRDKLQIQYGDFGPAEETLKERSGQQNYNMRLTTLIEDWELHLIVTGNGIVSSDGEKFHLFWTTPMTYVRITEAEARKLGRRLNYL